MLCFNSFTDAEDDAMSVDHPSTSSLTVTLHLSSDENDWSTPTRLTVPTTPPKEAAEGEAKEEDDHKQEQDGLHAWFSWREILAMFVGEYANSPKPMQICINAHKMRFKHYTFEGSRFIFQFYRYQFI